MKKKIAIITPVFNEESVIDLFYSRFIDIYKKINSSYELHLIFINNGSNDGSLKILKKIFLNDLNVSVISLSKNFGYQNALFFALQKIKSDLYTFVDIDCEDPPEMIINFLDEHKNGYDLVYGERVDRPEFFILKKLRNLFYRVIKLIADDSIHLYMAEFSLFSLEIRNAVIKQNNTFPFIRGSLASVGFESKAIKYKRLKRISGETHYNFFSMVIFAFAGILSSSTYLLRLPIYVFPFLIILFVTNIIYPSYIDFQDFISILILLITFYLSIISLYIARIYKNILNRPNAIITKQKTFIHKIRAKSFDI